MSEEKGGRQSLRREVTESCHSQHSQVLVKKIKIQVWNFNVVLKGKEAILRDVEGFDRWVDENLMELNKAKYKVLHIGRGNPNMNGRLLQWLDWEYICGDQLGDIVGWKQHGPAVCACSPESHPYPGLHQKNGSYQIKEGDCHFLFHSRKTWSRLRFGASRKRKTWTCQNKSREELGRWTEG